MVECQLPKLKVAGSNPVSRSKAISNHGSHVAGVFAFTITLLYHLVVTVVEGAASQRSCDMKREYTVIIEQDEAGYL